MNVFVCASIVVNQKNNRDHEVARPTRDTLCDHDDGPAIVLHPLAPFGVMKTNSLIKPLPMFVHCDAVSPHEAVMIQELPQLVAMIDFMASIGQYYTVHYTIMEKGVLFEFKLTDQTAYIMNDTICVNNTKTVDKPHLYGTSFMFNKRYTPKKLMSPRVEFRPDCGYMTIIEDTMFLNFSKNMLDVLRAVRFYS